MRKIILLLTVVFSVVSFTTTAQSITCSTPTNVQSLVTDSNIVLSWDTVPGVFGYLLKAGKVGLPLTITLKSYDNTFVIPKVPKCLEAYYSVQAYCSPGNISLPSAKDTFTTPGCINCDTPATLTTSNISSNSAKFSWSKVDDALFYVVEGRVVGFPKHFKIFLKDTIFNANFLPSGFTFEWRLYVVCSKTAIAGPTSWQQFSTPVLKNGMIDRKFSSIYPNPAQGQTQLQITSLVERPLDLRIIDISGKTVAEFESHLGAGINSIDLDLSDLQNGLYFVQFDSITEKLFVGN